MRGRVNSPQLPAALERRTNRSTCPAAQRGGDPKPGCRRYPGATVSAECLIQAGWR
jgi:hypothetical protein